MENSFEKTFEWNLFIWSKRHLFRDIFSSVKTKFCQWRTFSRSNSSFKRNSIVWSISKSTHWCCWKWCISQWDDFSSSSIVVKNLHLIYQFVLIMDFSFLVISMKMKMDQLISIHSKLIIQWHVNGEVYSTHLDMFDSLIKSYFKCFFLSNKSFNIKWSNSSWRNSNKFETNSS